MKPPSIREDWIRSLVPLRGLRLPRRGGVDDGRSWHLVRRGRGRGRAGPTAAAPV